MEQRRVRSCREVPNIRVWKRDKEKIKKSSRKDKASWCRFLRDFGIRDRMKGLTQISLARLSSFGLFRDKAIGALAIFPGGDC